MKKLLFIAIVIAAFTSCTVDNIETAQTENNLKYATTDGTNLGTYKGVFTTTDSKYRATVHVNIPQTLSIAANTETLFFPTAYITLHTGEVYVVKATEKVTKGDVIDNLVFESNEISFKLTVDNDGSNPEITDASFMSSASEMLVVKETSLAPVTPITGTYACTDCGGSPYLDSGDAQTFNMIFTSPDSDGAITLQTMLGTNALNGIGFQDSCVATGTETVCNINSGDGATTTISHLANGNPVFWTGTHTFNNEPTGPNDCSGASGTWSWMSVNYGLITGTFVSDSGCFQELYSEDFTGFEGSGFAPMPTAGQLDSDIIIATGFNGGALTYGGTATTGDYARGSSPGGVNQGGIYAFDTTAGNSSLGVQPTSSDFTPGTFEFRIENTTAAALNNLRVSYDVFVNNDENRSNNFNFSYSTDGITFTPLSALDFTSAAAPDALGFVSAGRIATFSANVPVGSFIYLRFTGDDVGGSNSRDEFSVDNILLEGY